MKMKIWKKRKQEGRNEKCKMKNEKRKCGETKTWRIQNNTKSSIDFSPLQIQMQKYVDFGYFHGENWKLKFIKNVVKNLLCWVMSVHIRLELGMCQSHALEFILSIPRTDSSSYNGWIGRVQAGLVNWIKSVQLLTSAEPSSAKCEWSPFLWLSASSLP